MNTCSTCKHWQEWKHKTVENTTFTSHMGNCRMVVMWWDASEWLDEPPFTREISPKYTNQRAFVQDASDYSASLYTRQDFGCIDHQPRSTDL
jgi:hypothetical protein